MILGKAIRHNKIVAQKCAQSIEPNEILKNLLETNHAMRNIRDCDLQYVTDSKSLTRLLSKRTSYPKALGVPSVELFDGQDLPGNIEVISYRKRKWTALMNRHFIERKLSH